MNPRLGDEQSDEEAEKRKNPGMAGGPRKASQRASSAEGRGLVTIPEQGGAGHPLPRIMPRPGSAPNLKKALDDVEQVPLHHGVYATTALGKARAGEFFLTRTGIHLDRNPIRNTGENVVDAGMRRFIVDPNAQARAESQQRKLRDRAKGGLFNKSPALVLEQKLKLQTPLGEMPTRGGSAWNGRRLHESCRSGHGGRGGEVGGVEEGRWGRDRRGGEGEQEEGGERGGDESWRLCSTRNVSPCVLYSPRGSLEQHKMKRFSCISGSHESWRRAEESVP